MKKKVITLKEYINRRKEVVRLLNFNDLSIKFTEIFMENKNNRIYDNELLKVKLLNLSEFKNNFPNFDTSIYETFMKRTFYPKGGIQKHHIDDNGNVVVDKYDVQSYDLLIL